MIGYAFDREEDLFRVHQLYEYEQLLTYEDRYLRKLNEHFMEDVVELGCDSGLVSW